MGHWDTGNIRDGGARGNQGDWGYQGMVAPGGPDNVALGYWEHWGLGTGGIQGMGAPKGPGDGGTGSTWVPELRAPGVPMGWEHREAGSTVRRGTKRWGHPGYREDWGNRDTGITGGGSTRGTGILRYQRGTRIPEIKAVGVFRRWGHWEYWDGGTKGSYWGTRGMVGGGTGVPGVPTRPLRQQRDEGCQGTGGTRGWGTGGTWVPWGYW